MARLKANKSHLKSFLLDAEHFTCVMKPSMGKMYQLAPVSPKVKFKSF